MKDFYVVTSLDQFKAKYEEVQERGDYIIVSLDNHTLHSKGLDIIYEMATYADNADAAGVGNTYTCGQHGKQAAAILFMFRSLRPGKQRSYANVILSKRHPDADTLEWLLASKIKNLVYLDDQTELRDLDHFCLLQEIYERDDIRLHKFDVGQPPCLQLHAIMPDEGDLYKGPGGLLYRLIDKEWRVMVTSPENGSYKEWRL